MRLDVRINAGPIECNQFGAHTFVHQLFPLDVADLLLQLKVAFRVQRFLGMFCGHILFGQRQHVRLEPIVVIVWRPQGHLR